MADEETQDGGQQHLEGALLRRAQHLHDQAGDGGVHDRVGRGLAADNALQVVEHVHLRAPSPVTARMPEACLLLMAEFLQMTVDAWFLLMCCPHDLGMSHLG